jgi:hypothetical protein
MKRITLALLLLFSVSIVAQQGINYKAVIKDGSGVVVASTAIDVTFIILDGVAIVYEETHAPTTDANGIVMLNIGEGTPVTGAFSAIDWSSNNHFLNVQIDTGGGLQDMGTTAFKTVPYALHSKIAETVGTCGLSIGDTYEGGIIFYLDASGCHGLIAAPTDQSTGIKWKNDVDIDTYGFGTGLFDGEGNCTRIRRAQGYCASTPCYAADLCLSLELNGYIGWYLPSKYELLLMYNNIGQGNALGLGNLGGFSSGGYWSSSEYDRTSAWFQQFFTNGTQFTQSKIIPFYVRAARAF